MPGQLTPLLLTAMQGFLDNNSIDINAEFLSEILRYKDQPIVKKYREISGKDHYYYDNGPATLPADTGFIITDIENVFIDLPFMTDVYEGTNCNVTAQYLTAYLLDWAYIILGKHRTQIHINNHGKFLQTLQIAIAHVDLMNDVINSATNSPDIGASTFTSMDELLTGNLSAVSTNTKVFGEDLALTGNYLDFTDLMNYGTPHALVKSLIRTNAIGLLKDEFLVQGIDVAPMANAVLNTNTPLLLEVQKLVYTVAESVTGKKLADVLLMMAVETKGLETLADILNTRKLFPNAEPFINTINGNKIERIFSSTGLSAFASKLNTPQVSVMPEEIAKSNLAFRNSLFQVKGIISTDVQELAEQFQTIEANTGLSTIEAFDSPTPVGVTGLTSLISTGQGPDGRIYVTDAVGTPCGTTHRETLYALNEYHESILQSLENSIVNEMQVIIDESWIAHNYYDPNIAVEPDPIDYPPLGVNDPTYIIDWNDWNDDRIIYIRAEVLPFLNNLIGYVDTLTTNHPEPVDLQGLFDASIEQVKVEDSMLAESLNISPSSLLTINAGTTYLGVSTEPTSCAGLYMPMTIPSAKKSCIGFTQQLHSLSSKTDLHNVVEVLEKLAISNPGGEAIVASLREGRNLKKLDKAGVKTDTKIDNQPKNVEPGELKPAITE